MNLHEKACQKSFDQKNTPIWKMGRLTHEVEWCQGEQTPVTSDPCCWPGCRVCGRDSVAALLSRDGGRDGIHLLQLQLSSGAVGTAAVSHQQKAKHSSGFCFAICNNSAFSCWFVWFLFSLLPGAKAASAVAGAATGASTSTCARTSPPAAEGSPSPTRTWVLGDHSSRRQPESWILRQWRKHFVKRHVFVAVAVLN